MKAFSANGMRPVRLIGIRLAAEDVNVYEFAPLDARPMEPFEPGAHIDLRLNDTLLRQYSLLPPLTGTHADANTLRIAVQTEGDGRGGSRFLAHDAHVGDVFHVSAARNHFHLVRGAAHSVLIAGGIGITPLFGMIGALQREGASWQLHYAVRSETRALFRDALRDYGDKVRIACSDRPDQGRLDLQAIVADAPPGSQFYCCGPQRMVDAFIDASRALPPADVHVERFSATTDAADEGGFEVRLVRSDRRFVIPPGSTILQALREAGMDVPSSCEQGVCGVCETRVLAGEPDHRDHVLSASEQAKGDTMMICCSGSRSPFLELDL
ncbi:PDR/VanB family oxidoreductase (plasmid) [Paraburkholderia sp. PREW-6R]|uniref:PDR/VanB family oxidoreductase n=1 Tax=Paraburkholderia sp. PREW-6R TaxID=3141544 RepID=UPI0031F57D73